MEDFLADLGPKLGTMTFFLAAFLAVIAVVLLIAERSPKSIRERVQIASSPARPWSCSRSSWSTRHCAPSWLSLLDKQGEAFVGLDQLRLDLQRPAVVHHDPQHPDLGGAHAAAVHRHRPALRHPHRPLAVRVGRQEPAVHAGLDQLRRRRHHLEVRLRAAPRDRRADRPAQPGPDLARRGAAQLPQQRPGQHALPDRRDDLDPGRFRDGAAVGGDQGHPGRHRRGGPARRRERLADVPQRHDPLASGPRWSSCSRRSPSASSRSSTSSAP